MTRRHTLIFTTLALLALLLFVVDLAVGDLPISISQVWSSLFGGDVEPLVRDVVLKIRLVRALVATIAGAALTVAGLQMQTIFRNPLAEPYLLGVSAGAGLGVSIYLLGVGLFSASVVGAWQSFGIAGAACVGAMAVMMLMMLISQRIKDIMVLLVLGMMLGSVISAIVMILQYHGSEAAVKSFVLWTMGSLGDVTSAQLGVMSVAVAVGLALAIVVTKPLDMLLLGEYYARTMGLRIGTTRAVIFTSTTLLAGAVTAFCGPIGFVGLATPHIARMLFHTASHRVLIPASILLGIDIMLACDLLSKSLLLPINAITALAGVPVVIYIVVRSRTSLTA